MIWYQTLVGALPMPANLLAMFPKPDVPTEVVAGKTKYCKMCDKVLPVDEFSVRRYAVDGETPIYQTHCLPCNKRRLKELWAKERK